MGNLDISIEIVQNVRGGKAKLNAYVCFESN